MFCNLKTNNKLVGKFCRYVHLSVQNTPAKAILPYSVQKYGNKLAIKDSLGCFSFSELVQRSKSLKGLY